MKLRFRKGGKGSGSYEITIPKNLIEALGWSKGLELEFKIININGKRGLALYPKDKAR